MIPKDKEHVSVGGALYGKKHKLPGIKEMINNFIEHHYAGCEKSNLITGAIPITLSPRYLCRNGVTIVGDSARMVNPLTAGGIMNTFEAADLMCNAIIKSAPYQFNNSIIHKFYTSKWNKKPRFHQKLFYILRELFLSSSDKDLLKTAKAAGKIANGIDRDKEFSFPLGSFFHILSIFALKTLKQWKILLK